MSSIAFREYGYQVAVATSGTDFDTDTIKTTLLLDAHSVDKDDANLNAMTLDECDSVTFDFEHGGNGRKTLAGASVNKVESGRVDFEAGADSTTWAVLAAAAGGSIQGALVHVPGTTNDTDAWPICFCDFGTAVAANGQDFIVNWDSGNTRDVMRWTFS